MSTVSVACVYMLPHIQTNISEEHFVPFILIRLGPQQHEHSTNVNFIDFHHFKPFKTAACTVVHQCCAGMRYRSCTSGQFSRELTQSWNLTVSLGLAGLLE